MELEGIHHITAITADAQQNIDFYVNVLGLRLVKKSVNQDQTSVYHLFYADETGRPRLGHHVLRVPGRAERPSGRRHDPPDRMAARQPGRRRLLG